MFLAVNLSFLEFLNRYPENNPELQSELLHTAENVKGHFEEPPYSAFETSAAVVTESDLAEELEF